jgi:uncharacterized membrane protein
MTRPSRLASLDVLRGLVMVLMALDHARDFFHDVTISVEHEADPGWALFLTRWVTHFCAPVFVFLAGTSVFLWRSRGKSAGETSAYLISRGAWLLVLEFTVVHFGWFFTVTNFFLFQVIAAIGASMIALGLLTALPHRLVLLLGIVLVAGHNALGNRAIDWSDIGWSLNVLHDESAVPVGSFFLYFKYPVLPWFGVLCCGYGFGEVFLQEGGRRRRTLLIVGAAVTLAFVLLRASSTYGDPVPWSDQEHGSTALMRFLNCEKYPPSLLFTLMTLGPAILFLGVFDRGAGALGEVLAVFGRVPLFYYVAHLYLLHGVSHALHLARLGDAPNLLTGHFPEGYGGVPLWHAYLAWLAAVTLLYFPCRWYAGVKKRNTSPILTYL